MGWGLLPHPTITHCHALASKDLNVRGSALGMGSARLLSPPSHCPMLKDNCHSQRLSESMLYLGKASNP